MRGANRNRAPSFWIALAAGDQDRSAFCGRPAAAPGAAVEQAAMRAEEATEDSNKSKS